MDSGTIKISLAGIGLFLLLQACQSDQNNESDSLPPKLSGKSEILFLENFKGRSARESGYFSNHIMTRRLSNLLKPEIEEALKWTEDCSALVEGEKGKTLVIGKDSAGKIIGFVHSWSAEDAIAFGWLGKEGWNVRKEYSSLNIPTSIPLPESQP